MDTYALAVQQLKKAIENAIEKAISNGTSAGGSRSVYH